MRRIPEDNSGHGAQRPNSNAGSNELDGLVELGMKKDALALARRILKTKSMSADEFGNALNAILTQADRCKPWAALVESAYSRLSKRGQRAARSWMISFQSSCYNHEAVCRFIPARFSSDLDLKALAFAMDAALALNKMDAAKKLATRLHRAIPKTDYSVTRSLMVTSLGDYLARTGKWGAAIEVLEAALGDEVFSGAVVTRMVEIHAARALRSLQIGFELIEMFNKSFDPESETTLPGNDKAIQQNAMKTFRRLQKILEKVVPKERQKELGLVVEHEP